MKWKINFDNKFTRVPVKDSYVSSKGKIEKSGELEKLIF